MKSRLACVALLAAIGGSAQAAGHRFEIAGGQLDIEITPGRIDLPESAVLDWVKTAARAVAAYYGRFPVRHARVEIRPVDGDGVAHGTTFGDGGGAVFIQLGRAATRAQLDDDWVMTHELVHLAFPSLPRRHHWMEEGLATYVEPIARVKLGTLRAEKIWGDLVEGLPNGLPRAGDRGLDRTPTWGRTYWGGALYFLLADIEIRRRTHNQKGLEHALRAINAAGGTVDADWSVERVIATGDAATGVPVLRELYDRMKASPYPVDLDDLWRRLGVIVDGGHVRFEAGAPLAAVREAITAR